MKRDNTKEKSQIVDDHRQMFEEISPNELGKIMKEAFANVLEIQKTI